MDIKGIFKETVQKIDKDFYKNINVGAIKESFDRIDAKFYLPMFYFLLFFYTEFLFKLLAGFKIFQIGTIHTIVYILFMTLLCYTISSLFNLKYNKIITYCITVIHCLYFTMQFGSYKVLNVFFTLSVSDSAGEILQFKNELVNIIKDYFFLFVLFLLPIGVLVFVIKSFTYEPLSKLKAKTCVLSIIYSLIFYLITLNSTGDHSPKSLTFDLNDMGIAVSQLGLTNSAHMDLLKSISNFEETIVFVTIEEEVEEVIDEKDIVYELNVLDLDFGEEPNSISEYLMNETGTYKNKYTGMFEGKNVILIMAESFSDIAVVEELTPTLHQLIHEGFDFTNFYSPTIFSTIGGEFQMLTGLYPSSDGLKVFKKGTNEFPYSIAQLFIDNGYTTNAYHNNEYTFQGRSEYIPSLRFETFMACGNGLEEYINPKWLQSDTDMINSTVDFYADEEKFFTFYATVSGHGAYDTSNKYAVNNMDTVEAYLTSQGLDYPSEIKYYLGAQMELDNALEALLVNLENKGVLDDTVIVLAGDHYPYLISNDKIDQAADYNKDDAIDISKSNLIIWNKGMESEVIDKVGSQIDIVPTILNLVGFDYDSRLYVGNDIFSTAEGVAMFADRSFITDQGRYYYGARNFIPAEGVEVADDYVKKMVSLTTNRISISGQIIVQDYYKDIVLKSASTATNSIPAEDESTADGELETLSGDASEDEMAETENNEEVEEE